MSTICLLTSVVFLLYVYPATTTEEWQGVGWGRRVSLYELLLGCYLIKCIWGPTVQPLPCDSVTSQNNLRCVRQGDHVWTYFCILWDSSLCILHPELTLKKIEENSCKGKEMNSFREQSRRQVSGLQAVHSSFVPRGTKAILGQHLA